MGREFLPSLGGLDDDVKACAGFACSFFGGGLLAAALDEPPFLHAPLHKTSADRRRLDVHQAPSALFAERQVRTVPFFVLLLA